MSKLDKMMISGVRSFAPLTKNILEFSSPMTLIVGANGTGKTTIIECLKYATTGNFPPNTKGGAFLYDPSLANDTDIKAEIKLRFINNAKETIECLRALQVSQRANKLIQKTIECTLSRINVNSSTLLTSKLADIDKEIPEHLGVSSALLDNVIFCHQEESTWPISEPRVLKEKLDQIFCSVKYNKAIKGLKDTKKTLGSDIKLKEQELSFFFKEKSKREALLQNIAIIEAGIVNKKNGLDKVIEDKARLINSLKKITDEIMIYQKIEQNYALIKIEFDNCKNFIKNFGDEILSDEEIKRLYAEINGTENVTVSAMPKHIKANAVKVLSEYEGKQSEFDLDQMEKDLNLLEKYKDEYREDVRKMKSLSDQVSNLKNKQDDRMVEMEDIRKYFKTEFLCGENDVKEKAVAVFTEMESSRKSRKNKVLEDKRKLNIYLEKRAEIRQLITEYSRTCKEIKEIDINKDIIIDYNDLLDIAVDLHEITEEYTKEHEILGKAYQESEKMHKRKYIEENLENIKGELSLIDGISIQKQIQKENNKLELLQAELKNIKNEIYTNRMNSERRVLGIKKIEEDLTHLVKTLLFKDKGKSSTKNCVKDDLKLTSFNNENFINRNNTKKNDVSEGIVIKNKVTERIAMACMAQLNGLNMVDISLNDLVLFLVTKNFNDESFEAFTNVDTIACEEEKSVESYLNEITACNNIITATGSASAVYKNFIRIGQQKKECPLCKKGMDQSESCKFSERLQRVILKMPEEVEATEKRKSDLEKTIQQIKDDNIIVQRNNENKKKVLELIKELEDFVVSEVVGFIRMVFSFINQYHYAEVFNKMNKGADTLEYFCDIPNGLVNDKELAIQNSHKMIYEYESKYKHVQKLECLKDLKQKELDAMGCMEYDIKNIQERVNDLKKRMDEKKNEYASFSNKIKLLETEKKEIDDEKMNRNNIAKRKELEEELINLELGNDESKQEKIFSEEESLKIFSENFLIKKYKFDQKIKKFEDLKNGILIIEKEILDAKNAMGCMKDKRHDIFIKEFCKRNDEIYSYDIPTEEYFEIFRARIMAAKTDYIQTTKDIERIKNRHHLIEMNMQLRSKKEGLIKIQEELEAFDFKRMDVLKEKALAYERNIAKMTGNEFTVKGELRQMNLNINAYKNDLENNYNDIPKKYIKCAVELRAIEMAVVDLDKCINGLDKAIVDFHRSKMDELNATLRELWTSTYKGNDIEYVELKFESSGDRAYNYSVVMVKGGTKMDMRGRCSAGQKMIASILIRLALSDSFSENCSILALDEPTTNLDRENIESLAATLMNLIKERVNVQLVIISHDEEFVEMLNREGIESFYRLRRDVNGCSHIERHSIYSMS